ncbi:rRNA maturation RNase YbeY [Allofrancisella guangzhouensis]|uniref:Endoribonuclease YbeY n=1 Tax=Allofrancisella guangzhouensis TaxID=594679 RepID=A0A0A8EAG4_9GAMM|nr:rRNA maturation RNase YbeY [Allofrancisella guangzhouensis]AJC49146.1 rRNA maturation factor [Allofrancisella guangzhouensis]MBK2026863.1 rRNA maturation RNase YbeY [Allofrancisella guangzhouensis]MBK2043613.1 rRNA maturation RNase YbeY [Allofrancisella guangzhouensis]MBK2046360.1 rRNA maturation RNase YbeY [Allofrancisella guangzhouensis]
MDSLNLNIINDEEHPILEYQVLLNCFELVMQQHNIKDASVNVNIVSDDEIKSINKQFRNKDKPTNIISFEFEKPLGLPDGVIENFLGDMVIAPNVLEKEAKEQNKNLKDHWCHIFIHGLLHLLKYDHQNDTDAYVMESLEIELLDKLNIPNPYLIRE